MLHLPGETDRTRRKSDPAKTIQALDSSHRMKKSHDAALRIVGIKQEKEGGKLQQNPAQTCKHERYEM